jgi:hypothetical protein
VQAKHVHTLYNAHGKTYEWLATHLRLSKSRITQDLKAFGWTTDYLKQHSDPKNVERFSFFQEVGRKKGLADRYTNDLQFQQLFNGWLTDGKLTDSKHVRQLETILSNPEATKVLGEDGFNAPAGVLIKADPALGSDLYDSPKRANREAAEGARRRGPRPREQQAEGHDAPQPPHGRRQLRDARRGDAVSAHSAT